MDHRAWRPENCRPTRFSHALTARLQEKHRLLPITVHLQQLSPSLETIEEDRKRTFSYGTANGLPLDRWFSDERLISV